LINLYIERSCNCPISSAMRKQILFILPALFLLNPPFSCSTDFQSLRDLILRSSYLTQPEKTEWLRALATEFFTQSLKPGDTPHLASAYRVISYGMSINRLPPERVVRAARLTGDAILYLGARSEWVEKIGIIAFWEELTASRIALGARLMGKIEKGGFSPFLCRTFSSAMILYKR